MRSLILIATLVASPVFAEDAPTEAEREAFIQAVAENGCKMTEAEAPEKLPAVGIDKETSGAIVEMLVAEGLAELSEDEEALILKTEGCTE